MNGVASCLPAEQNGIKIFLDDFYRVYSEFQGSIRNLEKRALFMKFYPEMP